jgi:lipopolysaccharide/colanic/teichoic acid biosynthesis glycosyltransferase
MLDPEHFVFRHQPRKDRFRKLLDSLLASGALLVASPILVCAVVAILLEDGRPIFLTQRRVGRFGKTFVIFKLRTMKKQELGDRLSPRDGNDTRITRVGGFLRKSSIDEIPQLLNIMIGDMALVGPRPEMPFVVGSYEKWQHLRQTPGLTGLWQVNARKTIALEKTEATIIDLEYIERRSLRFDILILARTIGAVLRSKGAF